MLLIHGEIDNNSGTFPLQSRRMYHALKGHGAMVRLVVLPHESHGYRARESVMHVLAEMIDWFDDAREECAEPRHRSDYERQTVNRTTCTRPTHRPCTPSPYVDAFTNSAVLRQPRCRLRSRTGRVARRPTWMQRIAMELNLSETVFLAPVQRRDVRNPLVHARDRSRSLRARNRLRPPTCSGRAGGWLEIRRGGAVHVGQRSAGGDSATAI